MILILLFATLYLLLYSLCKSFNLIPRKMSIKRVESISRIGKQEKDILDHVTNLALAVYNTLSTRLKWNISQKRKEELTRVLERVGSKDTVGRFYAKKLLYPTACVVGGYLLGTLMGDVKISSYIIKGTSMLLAVVFYFQPERELKKQIKIKNERLILEMPRFIRVLRYSPQNKSILFIIKDYLKSAKSGLEYDLMVLAADIEMIGENKALEAFARRAALPQVRELVSVMLTSGNSENINMSLKFVEQRFKDNARTVIEKELKRRPEILDTINTLVLSSLGLLFAIPMFIYVMDNLRQIFK